MSKNKIAIIANNVVTTKLTNKNLDDLKDLSYYGEKTKIAIINEAIEDYHKKNFKKFKEGKK